MPRYVILDYGYNTHLEGWNSSDNIDNNFSVLCLISTMLVFVPSSSKSSKNPYT